MIDGQPREGAPLAPIDAEEVRDRPRAADEEREQAARERDDREMRRRRLEDRTRQRIAAARSASTCRAASDRSTKSASAASRPDGIDGDERDVLAERRAQSPSDERVSDDHGGQHERERIELRAREHRAARSPAPRAGRVRPTGVRRRPGSPSSAQTNAGYAATSVRRNDDERDPGHRDGRHRDDEGQERVRGHAPREQVRGDRRRAHDERVQHVRLVEAVQDRAVAKHRRDDERIELVDVRDHLACAPAAAANACARCSARAARRAVRPSSRTSRRPCS